MRRHAYLNVGRTRLAVVSVPIARGSRLSAAEREVAALVVRGLSNAEIAEARGTSERTVANQVRAILAKLGIEGRREVARALIEEG